MGRINLPKHIRRASHILSLIATSDVKNVIQKNTALRSKHSNCTTLWKKVGRPTSAEIIKEVLGHTLSYPGVRWNSLYDSFCQIIDEKEKIPMLFEALGIREQCLKNIFE